MHAQSWTRQFFHHFFTGITRFVVLPMCTCTLLHCTESRHDITHVIATSSEEEVVLLGAGLFLVQTQ